MKEILDIINLKNKVGLAEEDATFRKQVQWYHYLLSNGMVELFYDNGKLIGFIEWIRLNFIPKNISEIYKEVGNDYTKGKVAFVCNAISLNKALYKLRVKAINKVKDADLICFHRKKTGKILCFKNVRRDYALSLS